MLADNACAVNPCRNNGQCVDEPFGFTCKCAEGFAGEIYDKVCSSSFDIVFFVWMLPSTTQFLISAALNVS
ncbi:hypothetical protein Btru_042205 [Bulinus truncatus]|nr:hypothetical protein Btru_042205 [Bulinus truncatus]